MPTLRAASPAAGSDDCILTASQAAEYTVHNVIGGDNAYDPTVFTQQVHLDGIVPIQTDEGISWTGSDQALCYVVFRLNEETGFFEFFDVTTEAVFSPDDSQDGRVFYVRAANQRGGLGKPTKTVVFRKADTYILTVTHLSGLGEDDDDEEEWKGWSTI